jgi:hypothetical protein
MSFRRASAGPSFQDSQYGVAPPLSRFFCDRVGDLGGWPSLSASAKFAVAPSLSRCLRQGGDFDFLQSSARLPTVLASAPSTVTQSPPYPPTQKHNAGSCSTAIAPDLTPTLAAPDSDVCISAFPTAWLRSTRRNRNSAAAKTNRPRLRSVDAPRSA